MTTISRAAQATALLGALFLTACGGPSTTQDMYEGERKGPVLETRKPTPPQPKKPALSEKRLASIKAFGLDHNAHPTQLNGLSAIDVRNTLGSPHFLRRDQGVQIWQYMSEDCILDLFLYQKEEGLSVDHTELRGPMLDSAGELSCFSKIVMGTRS